MKFLGIFLAVLMITGSCKSFAQNRFVGDWEGKLSVGIDLRVVFHIIEGNGELTATTDSPDQGVKDIKCSRVIAYDDSLIIEIASMGGVYRGAITGQGEITGKLEQRGKGAPLNLKKTDKAVVLNRPQTPQPPFDYGIEDIIYFNRDSSIRYGATLTIPKGKGPFPALLLLSGSGQQNRDEELFGHKPFAVVADYLTKAGYIVMRVDDRGMGQTTGIRPDVTTADFVKDAAFGIEYLKTRREVNPDKIGLYGHSEGGMIAEILAAQRKDIDFIVLMAGPGIANARLMEEQNNALFEKSGFSKEMIDEYGKLYRSVVEATISSKDSMEFQKAVEKAVADWRKKTDARIVASTTGITDAATEQKVVRSFVDGFNKPWIRYFLSYDPKYDLQKTKAKILALNGDKDIQVISSSNLAGMKETLKKGKTKSYEIKELPGLNHLFQNCKACTVTEYAQLEETMSPVALQTIKAWLDKEVK